MQPHTSIGGLFANRFWHRLPWSHSWSASAEAQAQGPERQVSPWDAVTHHSAARRPCVMVTVLTFCRACHPPPQCPAMMLSSDPLPGQWTALWRFLWGLARQHSLAITLGNNPPPIWLCYAQGNSSPKYTPNNPRYETRGALIWQPNRTPSGETPVGAVSRHLWPARADQVRPGPIMIFRTPIQPRPPIHGNDETNGHPTCLPAASQRMPPRPAGGWRRATGKAARTTGRTSSRRWPTATASAPAAPTSCCRSMTTGRSSPSPSDAFRFVSRRPAARPSTGGSSPHAPR